MKDLPTHLERARGYQLALRKISSSTNERTIISAILPPGSILLDSALVDSEVRRSSHVNVLTLCALLNTHCFDWIARQYVAANVNLFILRNLPVPTIDASMKVFLAHSAMRLCCNHVGFRPLWREQLGTRWIESKRRTTWPVVNDEADRWALRSSVDALVATAYGISRPDYEYVLQSFNHKNCPPAIDLCLRAFDELQKIGVNAFCRKHDPYFEVPLVTALPEPVIGFETHLAAVNANTAPSNDTEHPARGRGRGPTVKRAAPRSAAQRSTRRKTGR